MKKVASNLFWLLIGFVLYLEAWWYIRCRIGDSDPVSLQEVLIMTSLFGVLVYILTLPSNTRYQGTPGESPVPHNHCFGIIEHTYSDGTRIVWNEDQLVSFECANR